MEWFLSEAGVTARRGGERLWEAFDCALEEWVGFHPLGKEGRAHRTKGTT